MVYVREQSAAATATEHSESVICFSLLATKIALTGGEDRKHDGSYGESTSEHGLDKECRS